MGKFVISEIDKNPTIVKAIRLKAALVEKLEQAAHDHNISVNRLVIECIEYALADLDSNEDDDEK